MADSHSFQVDVFYGETPDSSDPRPDSSDPRPDSSDPRPDSSDPRPDSPLPRPDAISAEVSLFTEQLEAVLSKWLAHQAGIPLPVKYEARWGWSTPTEAADGCPARPGGPVLVAMRVWPVDGSRVVEFSPNSAKQKRGAGQLRGHSR